MSEWIKVEDRLPDLMPGKYHSKVLLLCVSDICGANVRLVGYRCSCADGNIGWATSNDKTNSSLRYGDAIVTHWMELPELPNEESET